MRMTVLGVFLVLVLFLGCQSTGRRTSTKQDALSRCGISPGIDGAIAPGTDNEFFTATARQAIKIKPGVEIKNGTSTDQKSQRLTLISKDNSLDLDCRCPAGCSESGDGCVYIVPIGESTAYCVGDCESESACCAGCGWY